MLEKVHKEITVECHVRDSRQRPFRYEFLYITSTFKLRYSILTQKKSHKSTVLFSGPYRFPRRHFDPTHTSVKGQGCYI